MARISGKDGAITLASTGTIHLKQWTITWSTADVDVSAFGDSSAATTPGFKRWRGSARGTLDGAANPAMPTAAVAGVFTTKTGQTFSGDVVVTEITPDVALDGEATVAVSFVGDGDLTP